MRLRAIMALIAALVTIAVPAASAQWADPTDLRNAGREDTSVTASPQASSTVETTSLASSQETAMAAQVELEQEEAAGRLVTESRPPVPPIPAPARAPIPCNPYATACPGYPGSPFTNVSRPSVPKPPSLTLKPSPTYNYQGCEIKLNVTGAPNGTLVHFEMQALDFGAFSDDGSFDTPDYQEIAHATVTNGVATVRVRNSAASSYLFRATSSAGNSNEYPVGWIPQTDPRSPCLS
jgi:hypothetical protein